jgi:RNA polymerase sigma-70 factor (ECF subfamily)
MDRYATGDMAAFAVVYDAVAPKLARFLRRWFRIEAEIEDIIQETFVQIHRARGTYLKGHSVVPWAFAIASNIVKGVFRRLTNTEFVTLEEEDARLLLAVLSRTFEADAFFEARETWKRISWAYGTLTDQQRAAFDLVELEGLSQRDAASILATTVTGIKLRIHKARLLLKEAAAGNNQKAA